MRDSLSALAAVWFLAAFVEVSDGYASQGTDEMRCCVLTDACCPALLLSEGDTSPERRLIAAYCVGGELRRQEVLRSKGGCAVTPLDGGRFLVVEGSSGRHTRASAIDLRAGRVKVVAETAGGRGGAPIVLAADANVRCLRSVPARRKAMLMVDDRHGQAVELFELDLATFRVTPRRRIPENVLVGSLGDGLDRRMLASVRVSPDFTRLAFATVVGSKPMRLHDTTYELKILDLKTMAVTPAVADMRVFLPSASSLSRGNPAFEWISNDEIIFQDIAPGPPDEVIVTQRDHIVKIAAAAAGGAVRELLRRELPLELGGGALRVNPLTGRIDYQRSWVIDMPGKRLLPRDGLFSVERVKGGETEIRRGTQVLYRGAKRCIDHCVSPSGLHLAYVLREVGNERVRREGIYVSLAGSSEPVMVAETGGFGTRPITWIERTK